MQSTAHTTTHTAAKRLHHCQRKQVHTLKVVGRMIEQNDAYVASVIGVDDTRCKGKKTNRQRHNKGETETIQHAARHWFVARTYTCTFDLCQRKHKVARRWAARHCNTVARPHEGAAHHSAALTPSINEVLVC